MLKIFRRFKPKPAFCENTPEDEIAAFIDAARKSSASRGALVELLPEQAPLYAGRSTNETIRLRGYILAAFERVELPRAAVPFVLDELENGRDPYLVAAAAKALRGLKDTRFDVAPFLLKAVRNVKDCDDALNFETYKARSSPTAETTALKEIFQTFGWLGGRAKEHLAELETLAEDKHREFSAVIGQEIERAIERIKTNHTNHHPICCAAFPNGFSPLVRRQKRNVQNHDSVKAVEFEDQNGAKVKYGEFFARTPSVVVFFYTRCNNPNKCSLTITKLAHLQGLIKDEGLDGRLKTAAITYDAGYDLPPRLKAYGENRQLLFGENHRVFRARTGFNELQSYYDLGANFVGSIVNRHKIELFILDEQGRIAATFDRLQWDARDVLKQARSLLEKGNSWSGRQSAQKNAKIRNADLFALRNMLAIVSAIAVAFFPKCPLCWAAYLSLFGITSLQSIPYSPWLLPIFISLMLVNLFVAFKRTEREKSFKIIFGAWAAGAFFILVPGYLFQIEYAAYFGILLVAIGSLASATYPKINLRGGKGEHFLSSSRFSIF